MAKKHFNELSPEEAELLALLMEEMGESIQIIGKILRHGLYSTNPTVDDGASNRELLEMELGDVQAAQDLLLEASIIRRGYIEQAAGAKLNKVRKYLHHYERTIAEASR